jgi:predicted TIM-barrel enzyme
MRYIETGKFGSVWGRRKTSTIASVSAIASRTSQDPTVVFSVNVFDDASMNDYDIADLVGAASIELTAEQVRRFAERLSRSADEAEERSRRLRYADSVKEDLP